MSWSSHRENFLESAAAAACLTEMLEDNMLSRPGLGTWNVAGLTGHLLRAYRTLLLYLSEPEPIGDPLPDAAAYFAAGLERRNRDPKAVDDAIATRGNAELAGARAREIEQAFTTAVQDLRVLHDHPADRLIASPLGIMHLVDYTRTRNLEIVVHSLDLAQAIEVDYSPPPGGLRDALDVLVELAERRGVSTGLILELTGRTSDSSALPLLQ